MEGDFLGDAFDVKDEGRGEPDHSFSINGVICIPSIDRFLQPGSGK